MTLRAAEQHYRTEAALAVAVTRQVARYWRQVPVGDIDAWTRALPAVAPLVAAGQYRAATGAEAYVEAALAEQRMRVAPDARVSPAGFAAMANGALPVLDLLDQPRIQALTAIGNGAAPSVALSQAGQRLETYVASLVQDAGRQADSTATFTRPTIGWVRMVNPPCCKDCAILAGRWYKSNQGFERHPRCDCRHVPAAEDAPGDVGTDPAALFGSGRVTGLRKAEADAIADGADPARVVNANRGRSADKMNTTASAQRGRQRLTPDGIYARATDRDDALRLLAENGYVLP